VDSQQLLRINRAELSLNRTREDRLRFRGGRAALQRTTDMADAARR